MATFSLNMEEVSTDTVDNHSISAEERERLTKEFNELKRKVEQEGYELTLEDQRTIVMFLRADRETKFILNSKPPKVVKEKVERVPKEPKVKAPKKLGQKALGTLILKEMNGEELSEDEKRNLHFTRTGEIL